MSVQFGVWNWEGPPPAPDYIEKVSATIAPYGPDSNEAYSKDGLGILYRAFHTVREAHHESQPHISPSGTVITWDGRLDNRADLLRELQDSLSAACSDLDIVAAAYEWWGTKCLGKLVGDWALSIWNPIQHALILAKDPIGARHLYYSINDDQVCWCTILDPLVLFAGKTFEISQEYIAGWFGGYPATHLTPYVGITSVPPSSLVLVRPGKHTITKFWDFDPCRRIRYRSDDQYEEHFRTVFATAVRRRLRSDRPVLAELSGGMDSSAIVCMADVVMARREAETPRLDTISYYDDGNPILNERDYFSKVEEKRGRTGYRIDLGLKNQTRENRVDSSEFFSSGFVRDRFTTTPDLGRDLVWAEFLQYYAPHMRSQHYRVTLSGIAGEDVTGGYVPTPIPELQDLLARSELFKLAHQLKAWAGKIRRPQLALLLQALRGFLTHSLRFPGAPRETYPQAWFQPRFVQLNKAALSCYPSRLRLFEGLPSFQKQMHLLNHERRYLASCALDPELLREIRYPYLDRDLLEFACAIPAEQMVAVGKRRFLMKRALVGIVPDELLNRKRRAVTQKKENVSREWPRLTGIGDFVISDSLGIVNSTILLEAIQKARCREDIPLDSLKRTIFLESWLRDLVTRGVLTMPLKPATRQDCSSLEKKRSSARSASKFAS